MNKAKLSTLVMFTLAFLASGILSCGSSGSGGSGPNPHPGPSPSVTCNSSERNFLITNNSGQDIWLGVTAGTVSCLQDSDCPTGASGSCVGAVPATSTAGVCGCAGDTSQCGSISQCNTNNNHCYWNLPSMTASQMHLSSGGTSNICFPAPASGQNIQWSGNIFARTGCDSNGQNCKTGECGNAANQACPVGTGGNPPTALAEFTLSNQGKNAPATAGSDYYDVSIINGVNVGIMMAPTSGTFTATSGDPYSCQTPGNTSASGQLSACNWTITPNIPTASPTDQSDLLRNVFPSTFSGNGSCPNGGNPNSLGYCTCSATSDCSSQSLLCGLAMNASTGQQYTQVCGTQIGWWTADQLCKSDDGTSGSTLSALSCNASNNDLYSCTGTNAQSCYNNAADGNCCGCATSASSPYVSSWPLVFSPNFGGSDNACYDHNSNWFTVAQPWIVFLKQACPTAYTYPYDDATSTFTCQGPGTSTSFPDYNITFVATH